MNSPIPKTIGGAEVVCFTEIDDRHQRTGNTTHYVDGKIFPEIKGLAVCQYQNETGYYLFYCDDSWNDITDTYHDSLEDAINQAEFEYKNAEQTLISIK